MESQPVSPKPDNKDVNNAFRKPFQELNETEKKTSDASIIFKDIPVKAKMDSIDNNFQLEKEKTLKTLDSYDNINNATLFIQNLSLELRSDTDIVKKIFNLYYSEDKSKTEKAISTHSISRFLVLLKFDPLSIMFLDPSSNKLNLKIIKSLILKSDNPFYFLYGFFAPETVDEMVDDLEWVLEVFKKTPLESSETDIDAIPLSLLKELQNNDDFRIKAITACPDLIQLFKPDEKELIEILTISDHPFYLIDKYVPHDMAMKITSDEKLVVIMCRNSVTDIRETRSFDNICSNHKGLVFDIFSKENLRLEFKKNPYFYLIVVKHQSLINNDVEDYSIDDIISIMDENDLLESVKIFKNKKDPIPFQVEWLFPIELFDKICQIEPRYLLMNGVRELLKKNPDLKQKLLQGRGQFLIYLYDNKKNILDEAKKLDDKQLNNLFNEIKNNITPEKKELDSLFYESLEKAISEMIRDRQLQKTKQFSSRVNFSFE